MANHSPRVSQAIKAALNDINLLRALVNAPDADVNTILTGYSPKYGLEPAELAEFLQSLRHGRIDCTVSDLVAYYDGLQPPKVERKGDTREEWTP